METLNGLNTIARAQFVISIGETYDFEFVPDRRGDLRFELRANFNGTLLARVPIRVE
jgi:hypothetical protein